MYHFCKKTLSNKYKAITFTETLKYQLNVHQETYKHIHGSIAISNGKKNWKLMSKCPSKWKGDKLQHGHIINGILKERNWFIYTATCIGIHESQMTKYTKYDTIYSKFRI